MLFSLIRVASEFLLTPGNFSAMNGTHAAHTLVDINKLHVMIKPPQALNFAMSSDVVVCPQVTCFRHLHNFLRYTETEHSTGPLNTFYETAQNVGFMMLGPLVSQVTY